MTSYLVLTQRQSCLDYFGKHIRQFFLFEVQTGPELSSLNFRIVQSEYGISFDRTGHIQKTILGEYWRDMLPSKVYFRESPSPNATSFEKGLYSVHPCTDKELQQFKTKHNGSLPHCVGSLLHPVVFA